MGFSQGWRRHPAVRMWRGYEPALMFYLDSMIREWTRRGYNNNILSSYDGRVVVLPDWLGREDFHASHRSNLLRKNPSWYGRYGWGEPSDLPYVWPGRVGKELVKRKDESE